MCHRVRSIWALNLNSLCCLCEIEKLSEAMGSKLAKRGNEQLKMVNPALSIISFESMKTEMVAISLRLLEMQLQQQIPLDKGRFGLCAL